jgi:actin-related protein
MTQVQFNHMENREKITQVIFEVFSFPCLFLRVQIVLALYPNSGTTIVGLDSSVGVSLTQPIYESNAIRHAIQSIQLAKRDIKTYLYKKLDEKGVTYCSRIVTLRGNRCSEVYFNRYQLRPTTCPLLIRPYGFQPNKSWPTNYE